MKNKKIIFMLLFTFSFIVILLFNLEGYCFASTPKIINKLSDAFNDVEGWLIKLSTPAAAVAVGVGLFMKKFSFGDEERIRIAKKVIRSSLVSYGILLALDLILSAIKSLIS